MMLDKNHDYSIPGYVRVVIFDSRHPFPGQFPYITYVSFYCITSALQLIGMFPCLTGNCGVNIPEV